MRTILLAATGLLALVLLAPGASAVYQPPPICPACTVIVAIVAQCTAAEAQQDVFDNGDGCAIVNQQQDCVQDEADQDVFNDGAGCGYVNSQQYSLECRVRQVEALLGLAPAC